MMKAIQITEYGGAKVLAYNKVPLPKVKKNFALIKLKASGVNFIDIYQRRGQYAVELPFIPGLEGAGVVEDIGENIAEIGIGDKVAFAMVPQCYAEYVAVPANKLVPIPDTVDFKTAAASMLQGMTAHYLTHSTYKLKEGDSCLVHAAAGGVGLLLIQMAKAIGATVYGTVSTEEKAKLALSAGADHIIQYTREDFEKKVLELTDGKGVNVVYDSVGKDTFEGSLNSLQPLGLLALFGQAGGKVPDIDPQILNTKGSLFLTRPSLAHYVNDHESLLLRANDVLSAIASGRLKIRMDFTFPLKEAKQAHEALEGRKTTGKVLLIP